MSDKKGSVKNRKDSTARGRDLGVNAEIGRKLKQYYDSIVSEEVPDRFSQLLGQLEKAEQKSTQD